MTFCKASSFAEPGPAFGKQLEVDHQRHATARRINPQKSIVDLCAQDLRDMGSAVREPRPTEKGALLRRHADTCFK
jgi:hypothetical protein